MSLGLFINLLFCGIIWLNMTNNIVATSIKYVIVDLIGDFLYWPIWWYSKGLYQTIFYSLNQIIHLEEMLGLRIWVKNLFTPMFGQYDIEGRLISFFMRLVQIIFRTIALVVGSLLWLLPIGLWIISPLIVVYQIVNNFIFFFR